MRKFLTFWKFIANFKSIRPFFERISINMNKYQQIGANMNKYFFDDIIQYLCMDIDKYVLSHLKIKWNHNYEWKMHPYLPSKEQCEHYGIEYGEEQPGAFQLVLYDHGKPVYSAGCILIGKHYNKISVDHTYDRFFDSMKSYQESHKYFSLFLWYLRKKTHITLYNDVSK